MHWLVIGLARECYRNYKRGMLEMGFRISVFHPCLFVKLVAEKSLLIVSVATDDMLKASTRDDKKSGAGAVQRGHEAHMAGDTRDTSQGDAWRQV